MKFKKFLISVFAFILVGSFFSSIKAQNIGDIYHFRISYWEPGYTSYVTKTHSFRPHVLNLNDTSGPVINVFYTLLNSNDAMRSEEAKMSTRSIGYSSNRGEAGYMYKLKIKREYIWDGNAYIDGSWSPDRR